MLRLLLPLAALAGCSARATAPAAPVSTVATACSSYTTGARFAITIRDGIRKEKIEEGDGRYVLRINSTGLATLDRDAVRFSWSPGQPIMFDGWGRHPRDWTAETHVRTAWLTDVWHSCRAGFADYTWGPLTQYSGWTEVDATMPYTWAAGWTVRIVMRGPTASDLHGIALMPPGVTRPQDGISMGFSISDWDVPLSPNALNPELPDNVSSPVPWSWLCVGQYAEVSCADRTGWAPAGTGPQFQ